MLLGVALTLTALTVSTIIAIVVDTAYQAISHRRWPAEVPPMAVAISVMAFVVGASLGSAFV